MEPTLAISIAMLLVIMFGCLYMLKVLGECKKIIKSMKRRSKKYMKEVVSND
jgi:hypothetical protein